LAQEELGKALWIYAAFESDWSQGNEVSRTVRALKQHGRDHTKKYLEAFVYGDELASFWGDHETAMNRRREGESWESAWTRRQQEAQTAATAANLAKQRGFYVDRDEASALFAPTAVEVGTIADDLQTAAQVVEMLLIRDHSRMKMEAKTPYDSTDEQQFRLLPVSHPEDWAAASDEFKNGIERPT
jgi:AbiV family abortive infection protein